MEILDAAKVIWGGIVTVFDKFIAVAETIPGVGKLLSLGDAWNAAEKLRISTEAATEALKKHGNQAQATSKHLETLADAMGKTNKAATTIVFKPATMDLGTLKDRNTLEEHHLAMLRAEAQLQAFQAGWSTGVWGDQAMEGATKIQEAATRASSSIKNIGDALKLNEAAAAPFTKIAEAYKTLGVTSSQSLKDEAAEAVKAYNTIKNSGLATADQLRDAWIAMTEAQVKMNEGIDKTVPLLTRLDLFTQKFKAENSAKGGIASMFGADTFKTFQSSFNSTITGLINGTMKFKNAWRSMGSEMLASWGSTLGSMLTQWVSHLALKLGRYVLTNMGILTSDSTTGAMAAAANVARTLAMITSAAALAGANAFASTSAIPIVGPELAPAAAAAAYAGTLSFAAVSAERGGLLPNHNTFAFLHPEELVLPRSIAGKILGMTEGGGGRGHTFNQNVSYKANAPTMSKTELMKFTRRSGKALIGMAKNRSLGI